VISAAAYDWIPSLGIRLSFYVDGLSLLFAMIISGIGILVLIYTGAYLAEHRDLGRFYAYILFFMSSMLGLVLADNVITLFVFWELTSVSSYFLIGFNHERQAARSAALQALLVTGAGGLALLVGLLLLAHTAGSYELSEMIKNAGLVQNHPLYLPILLLVLAGAFTKSAQVPFHFWLPGAMEAPAPVSAYLHSATMVKAGVYLLMRLNPVLGGTDEWHYLIAPAGALTMLTGAIMALRQSDLKLILAYSTVSALGTLMLMLGLGTAQAAQAAVVFLLVHTLYKGALFLAAGSVDHETGSRDVNILGGLKRFMPFTAVASVFAALAMAGLPPMLGFIGKELLYEAKLQAPAMAPLITISGVLASMLMVALAGIVGYQVFFGKVKKTPLDAHEAPFSMLFGPLVLAGLGLLIGLMPDIIAERLISPAVSSLRAEVTEVKLALWHGLNPVFALSLFTFAGGVGVFVFRLKFLQLAHWLKFVDRLTPTSLYRFLLNGMLTIARIQTQIIQNGHLRYYLITVFGVTSVLVGFQLIKLGGFEGFTDLAPPRFFEVGLAVLMLLAALNVIFTSSLMGAIVSLAIVGYGVSLFYILFSAPDLAMTQFLIETSTLILFVLVASHLPDFKKMSSLASRIRDAILALSVGGVMAALVIKAGLNQFHPAISGFFVENSQQSAHGRNIVNVILVDFRALDTLGEITVLAVAAIGVYALVSNKNENREKNK